MLSACAAAAVGIDPDVLVLHLDIQIFLDIRHHIQRDKRGLPLALGIKGRYPHQAVHAFLRFQIPVSILAVDLERHGFDPRLIAVQHIQRIDLISLFLCPSRVHAVEHTAPVTALRAARSRI